MCGLFICTYIYIYIYIYIYNIYVYICKETKAISINSLCVYYFSGLAVSSQRADLFTRYWRGTVWKGFANEGNGNEIP